MTQDASRVVVSVFRLTPTIWCHEGESEKDIYHYTGCGLDDVFLSSGYELESTPYGNGVRIKNLDNLHTQIGLHLIKSRKTLNGKEIRFLRHQMDLTQSELARFFGCNVQQVARYGLVKPITPKQKARKLLLKRKKHKTPR